MDEIKEICADVRNKLQRNKTVLEQIESGKIPSHEFVLKAAQDIEKIEETISNIDSVFEKSFLLRFSWKLSKWFNRVASDLKKGAKK